MLHSSCSHELKIQKGTGFKSRITPKEMSVENSAKWLSRRIEMIDRTNKALAWKKISFRRPIEGISEKLTR